MNKMAIVKIVQNNFFSFEIHKQEKKKKFFFSFSESKKMRMWTIAFKGDPKRQTRGPDTVAPLANSGG